MYLGRWVTTKIWHIVGIMVPDIHAKFHNQPFIMRRAIWRLTPITIKQHTVFLWSISPSEQLPRDEKVLLLSALLRRLSCSPCRHHQLISCRQGDTTNGMAFQFVFFYLIKLAVVSRNGGSQSLVVSRKVRGHHQLKTKDSWVELPRIIKDSTPEAPLPQKSWCMGLLKGALISYIPSCKYQFSSNNYTAIYSSPHSILTRAVA